MKFSKTILTFVSHCDIMITTTRLMEEYTMSLTIFAQRMKQAREQKNMKQNELAKIIGVTPTTISSYEKSDDEGNGKKPTLENAQAIAKALGVSLDWISGASNSINASFADFTAKDFFNSLITVLMETSSVFDDSLQNGIVFNNPDIIRFAKKVSDLIKVYRAGSIPEDLFNVCIEKILDDLKDYTAIGNCILDDSEAIEIEQSLYNLIYENDPEIGFGEYKTSVSKNYGYGDSRTVKIIINPKVFDRFTPNNNKAGENNGNDNKKDE